MSFEIDRVDEVMSEGWSVLVTGEARRVDDPKEVTALGTLGLAPWAGGPRHALVRIHPDVLTGRVIVAGGRSLLTVQEDERWTSRRPNSTR